MKTLNSLPVLAVLCSLVFLLFAGVECNKSNDPNIPDDACQDFRSFKVIWKKYPEGAGERLLDPSSHTVAFQDEAILLYTIISWYKKK